MCIAGTSLQNYSIIHSKRNIMYVCQKTSVSADCNIYDHLHSIAVLTAYLPIKILFAFRNFLLLSAIHEHTHTHTNKQTYTGSFRTSLLYLGRRLLRSIYTDISKHTFIRNRNVVFSWFHTLYLINMRVRTLSRPVLELTAKPYRGERVKYVET